MTSPFFSRRAGLFGNVAVVILFVVWFLVPFAFRGARMAVRSMKNNVKDWLPKDFPETEELAWFSKHFLGETFVVITWPGCTRDDPSFQLLEDKLRAETVPDENDPAPAATSRRGRGAPSDEQRLLQREEERAHRRGDELGLFFTGDYYENWGGRGEKWLRGDGDRWYFITPAGELYQWDGDSNVIGAVARWFQRRLTGRNTARGQLCDRFGSPPAPGRPNPFYADPHKLMARFFKTVWSGPDLVEQLAGEHGWLRTSTGRDRLDAEAARRLAYERLTGILFAPEPPAGFGWTVSDFRRVVPQAKRDQLPDGWERIFRRYVDRWVQSRYGGRAEALAEAPRAEQAQCWENLFAQFGVEPPARQTCILATLSEPGLRDLRRVVGRPMLGRPPGRVLQLAVGQCGIRPEDLRLGGPPVDNVAIDEEGMITLAHLIGFSALVGMMLAYFCLRSLKLMFFVLFVGGVSAAASLGILWWCGSEPDAISMSMPSLVYVLGISGSIHIVNYYRDAVRDNGLDCAPETALKHGWFPCTLAAFTTALGLMSLCVSNLIPIKRFGFYSAIGVMATLVLLFGFLPAALQIWTPKLPEARAPRGAVGRKLGRFVSTFWQRFGGWIVQHHRQVTVACTLAIVLFSLGLRKIRTSVQLLKLFDQDARIIQDYTWLESHLCKLVPVELVACVDRQALRPTLDELEANGPGGDGASALQLSFLERAELAGRIQQVLEREFGESGLGVAGRGMSAAVFIPPFPDANGGGFLSPRAAFNGVLEQSRDELLSADYLSIDQQDGRELWRISLRVGALKNVDYGEFVNELKTAVEPILSAYRYRNKILRQVQRDRGRIVNSSVYVLGIDPRSSAGPRRRAGQAQGSQAAAGRAADAAPLIDQTRIFAETLDQLLRNRGFRGPTQKTRLDWHDPDQRPLADQSTIRRWAAYLETFDCVVLAKDHPDYDLSFIRQHARHLIDARDHRFDAAAGPNALTAAQRRAGGDPDTTVTAVYTGIVPIVYKAEHALLRSLINSIGLAFVMIAVVMMLLLRDWKRPFGLRNTLNAPGGLIAMLPNVFPAVLIFGAMGHLGITVDIGSMMTASVAMGVAVDDTIHFLNWFRYGLRDGLSRREAIAMAYQRCATAMTQTTLVGGLGLAVFAFSSFTPTQQFGVLMLLLLAAALMGDLVFLPALLAGPLGRYFEVVRDRRAESAGSSSRFAAQDRVGGRAETLHSPVESPDASAPTILRRDRGHDRLGG